MTALETSDLEIKRAAQLSLTEISLGSIGHGFKIPLTGQILSLNQLAFLLNAVNRDELPRSSIFEISSLAAILKSLSPAGSKLGPMLSIAMQGFLLWLSTALFGLNILGQIIGAVLLSLWAFVQPLIGLLFIYGFDSIKLVEFYLKKLNDDYAFLAVALVYAVLGFLILKLAVAIAFVIWSVTTKKKISVLRETQMVDYVLQQIPNEKGSAFKGALKDLTKPLFLLSFILMMIFVWQLQGSFSEKIWLSLRPLAVAFILFYILRSSWVSEKLLALSKKSKSFERVYLKAQKALDFVTQRASRSSEVSARREIK